jgi:hypothetical protein
MSKKKKAHPKPKKNPTDPILLARAVLEAAIGEPLTSRKSPKKKPSGHKAKR